MKKIILLSALLFATQCAFAESPTTAAPNAESGIVLLTNTLKLIPKTQREENRSQSYVIDVTFPVISGDLSDHAQQFNALIADLVKQEIDKFHRYLIQDRPHMMTLPEESRNNSLRIDYDVDVVKTDKDPIVSIRLSIEGFQAGRPHPYHVHRVLNYDLASGQVLTLENLFKPKSKYLAVIAKYAHAKLNEKLEDKWMIGDGTKPIAKNYQVWNLENNALLITFEEYQVAAYIYGSQEIEIPYSALKSIISPTAPIYPCAEDPQVCSGTINIK